MREKGESRPNWLRRILIILDFTVGIYIIYRLGRSMVVWPESLEPAIWPALLPIMAMGILLIVSGCGFIIWRKR